MRMLRDIDIRRLSTPLAIGFGVFAATIILLALAHAALFGPVGADNARVEFIVEPDMRIADVAHELSAQGLVRHGWVFQIAYALSRNDTNVRPGGYLVASSMDIWAVAKTLGQAPYLAWVTIPEGLRREQVAQELQEQLGWTDKEREAWLAAATATTTALTEGVFHPDIYLIPSDQSPEQVALRLRDRFMTETKTLQEQAHQKELVWEEVVILASLIERESAKNDKRLVSGILWNRLNKDMILQVDATLQYATGTPQKWWPVPTSDDKYIESPFNTYLHAGLPPAPIATPSLASIEAAINPQKTSCLYYLHDNRGRIHCATSYKGHLANINLYLK